MKNVPVALEELISDLAKMYVLLIDFEKLYGNDTISNKVKGDKFFTLKRAMILLDKTYREVTVVGELEKEIGDLLKLSEHCIRSLKLLSSRVSPYEFLHGKIHMATDKAGKIDERVNEDLFDDVLAQIQYLLMRYEG